MRKLALWIPTIKWYQSQQDNLRRGENEMNIQIAKSMITCKRLPIGINGCTSPRVPTISITICMGLIYWKPDVSKDSFDTLLKISSDSTLTDWDSMSLETSSSAVPSSFTVVTLCNNLNCKICKH